VTVWNCLLSGASSDIQDH